MYFMKMDLSSYRTIIHKKYQIKKIADHISTSKALKALGNLSFPFLKFTVAYPVLVGTKIINTVGLPN